MRCPIEQPDGLANEGEPQLIVGGLWGVAGTDRPFEYPSVEWDADNDGSTEPTVVLGRD